jgi:Sulfotransferase family
MTPLTRAFRPVGVALRRLGWRTSYGILDPSAHQFYSNMIAAGYDPTKTIDVVPEGGVIYVSVPKAASTSIKTFLSTFLGRKVESSEAAQSRRLSGLRAPHHVGLSRFYRLATDPKVLRFSFVRNPYARLVSCWSDKFKDKPLIAGDPFVNVYCAWLADEQPRTVAARGATLTFPDFVNFACQTARDRIDPHWQLQSDIINVPGLALDFIGRVESFKNDFVVVCDHLALPRHRVPLAATRISSRGPWKDFYTTELANTVYQTYERDFDQFEYRRALTDY